jgi:hypothetical protein
LLPYPGPSDAGFATNQYDPRLGQLLLELSVPVGQTLEQLAGYHLPQLRLGEQFFGQRDFRHVGGCKLVRESSTRLVAQSRCGFTP